MSRYVDVTPFTAELQMYANYIKDKHASRAVSKTLETVIEQIGELPTADVAPVIHSHWVKGPNNEYCFHCGAVGNCGNYCHYCGAKMDEKENKNESV